MISQIRVGRCSIKAWTWIFVFLQLFLLTLIITCLSIPDWIYSNIPVTLELSNSKFDFSELECGVIYCNEPEYNSYSDLIDKINDEGNYDSDDDIVDSLKKMLRNLSGSGAVLIIFYSGCLFGLFIWFIAMIVFLRGCNIYWCTWICSFCSCGCFYAGSIMWFVYAPSSFDNCDSFPEDSSTATVCTSSGPILSIVIMIFFPPITILYLVISIKAYRRRTQSEINESPQIVNQIVQNNIGYPPPVASGHNWPQPPPFNHPVPYQYNPIRQESQENNPGYYHGNPRPEYLNNQNVIIPQFRNIPPASEIQNNRVENSIRFSGPPALIPGQENNLELPPAVNIGNFPGKNNIEEIKQSDDDILVWYEESLEDNCDSNNEEDKENN